MANDLNYVDAEIVNDYTSNHNADFSQNQPQEQLQTNLSPQMIDYLEYISFSCPVVARKTLRYFGYPLPNEEFENAFHKLHELLIDLIESYPESYEYLIKQTNEFKVSKKIILAETKVKEKSKYSDISVKKDTAKNFTSSTTTTDYDLIAANNKHNTNLLLIAVAGIFALLIFSNKI